MRLRRDNDNNHEGSILFTLLAVLICMLILVFQSFREREPIEYAVQIEDSRDPNRWHLEGENAINLYGPTSIFIRRDYDMPLDEE